MEKYIEHHHKDTISKMPCVGIIWIPIQTNQLEHIYKTNWEMLMLETWWH